MKAARVSLEMSNPKKKKAFYLIFFGNMNVLLDIVEVDKNQRAAFLFECQAEEKKDFSKPDAETLLEKISQNSAYAESHVAVLKSLATHVGENPYAENPKVFMSAMYQSMDPKENTETKFSLAQEGWFRLVRMRAEYFGFRDDLTPDSPSYLKKCFLCGKAGCKRCGKCQKVHYCSANCFAADWPNHKNTCSASTTLNGAS